MWQNLAHLNSHLKVSRAIHPSARKSLAARAALHSPVSVDISTRQGFTSQHHIIQCFKELRRWFSEQTHQSTDPRSKFQERFAIPLSPDSQADRRTHHIVTVRTTSNTRAKTSAVIEIVIQLSSTPRVPPQNLFKFRRDFGVRRILRRFRRGRRAEYTRANPEITCSNCCVKKNPKHCGSAPTASSI